MAPMQLRAQVATSPFFSQAHSQQREGRTDIRITLSDNKCPAASIPDAMLGGESRRQVVQSRVSTYRRDIQPGLHLLATIETK